MKSFKSSRRGSEHSTYIRTHRDAAKLVMVGLEERESILLTAAPKLL
jgi:hypothetical protein